MLWLLPGLLKRLGPLSFIPASLLPLVLSVVGVTALALTVPQVGEIPAGFPLPKLIHFDLDLARNVFPSALTIAMLGAIEALLCAVVADGMTGTKHDSDKELKSQGFANTVLPFFGGIAATAAIARTAVNVREGAKTRVAGIMHGLFLLSFMLVLGPIVGLIPKAFLAGILLYVSARMINIREIRTIIRISKQETIVLFVTMGLTVLTDLVLAVQIGMILAVFLLFVKIVDVTKISVMEEYDPSDTVNALVNENPQLKKHLAVYTINGPFFFGAMSVFEQKLNEHRHVEKPIILLRMKHVPFVDSTGQARLKEFVRHRNAHCGIVLFSGCEPQIQKQLRESAEFCSLVPEEHMFARSVQAILYADEQIRVKSVSPSRV
jgi:SulP family sulfate permease